MLDTDAGALWLVSGGASVLFLAWALAHLAHIRRTGNNPVRRWFLVFLLSMIAMVLAGVAGAAGAPPLVGAVLPGAALALAGLAMHRAARTQRDLLEAAHAA